MSVESFSPAQHYISLKQDQSPFFRYLPKYCQKLMFEDKKVPNKFLTQHLQNLRPQKFQARVSRFPFDPLFNCNDDYLPLGFVKSLKVFINCLHRHIKVIDNISS